MIQSGMISIKNEVIMMMHQPANNKVSGSQVLKANLDSQMDTLRESIKLKRHRLRQQQLLMEGLDRFKGLMVRKRQHEDSHSQKRLAFPLLLITSDEDKGVTVELTPNGSFLKAHGCFASFQS